MYAVSYATSVNRPFLWGIVVLAGIGLFALVLRRKFGFAGFTVVAWLIAPLILWFVTRQHTFSSDRYFIFLSGIVAIGVGYAMESIRLALPRKIRPVIWIFVAALLVDQCFSTQKQDEHMFWSPYGQLCEISLR